MRVCNNHRRYNQNLEKYLVFVLRHSLQHIRASKAPLFGNRCLWFRSHPNLSRNIWKTLIQISTFLVALKDIGILLWTVVGSFAREMALSGLRVAQRSIPAFKPTLIKYFGDNRFRMGTN